MPGLCQQLMSNPIRVHHKQIQVCHKQCFFWGEKGTGTHHEDVKLALKVGTFVWHPSSYTTGSRDIHWDNLLSSAPGEDKGDASFFAPTQHLGVTYLRGSAWGRGESQTREVMIYRIESLLDTMMAHNCLYVTQTLGGVDVWVKLSKFPPSAP